MKLIDRYVYAVTEHLPTDIREDVGKELRANIEDMLSEDYTENDVYKVLEELGSPWKLANEYNQKKRYIIGPGFYDKYISTLKMVIGICVLVFVGITLLDWILRAPMNGIQLDNYVELITKLITSSIVGALQGTFWVTLVFIILERSGAESGYLPFMNKHWTPEDLPEIPVNDKRKISRGEIAFSMFCTILFTALIFFKPQLIALYIMGDHGEMGVTPLLDVDRLSFYLPIILILAIIQLGSFVWKYIVGRWNRPMAVSNAIYNIVISILVIVMVSDKSLLNINFLSTVTEYLKASPPTITTWIEKSKWIFVLVFIGICIWDSIAVFIKCFYKTKD